MNLATTWRMERFPIFRAAAMVLLLAAMVLGGNGCVRPGQEPPPPKIPHPHLTGKINGNAYISSRGKFSVPFPVSPEVGGRVVRDDSQSVTFHDNWGSKISFYSRPALFDSPFAAMMAKQGKMKALETLLRDIYGNSTEVHDHPDVRNGSVSFIYLKPVGPKTGVAAFFQDDRVFLVETDLLPGVQLLSRSDDASDAERNVWLEDRALELLRTITVK